MHQRRPLALIEHFSGTLNADLEYRFANLNSNTNTSRTPGQGPLLPGPNKQRLNQAPITEIGNGKSTAFDFTFRERKGIIESHTSTDCALFFDFLRGSDCIVNRLPHVGCELESPCGACTVLLDGKSSSILWTFRSSSRRELNRKPIEGLGTKAKYCTHCQKSLLGQNQWHAMCRFCTPAI